MSTQQKIQMAAKLYDCRDTARRLLGEAFSAKVAEYSEVIKLVMSDKKIDALTAGIFVSKQSENPMTVMMVLAATVEMIEPSPNP
jgi:hypothetical protein